MRPTYRRTCLVALLISAALPGAARAAFECPVKAPAATHPLPADLGRAMTPYADPRADPVLRAGIRSMGSEGMPQGEIVDHMIAAYCPAVAAVPGLSDGQKQALVRRFASRAAQAVYAPPTGAVEDILVDVPVPTDLYTRLKEAADQRHESQDAFVIQALRTAAGSP